MSLALEAKRLDAHIHCQLFSTLSPVTKKHIPRRPSCFLKCRSGATVPSGESECVRVRSSSFANKTNDEVSDWYHASKYRLFASFARLSSRASSRCLPLFASRRRLLDLRRRSFRTPDCRSSVDLACLGAKKDYKEMLAKKGRLSTDEDALVLRLNVQANFPEQRRAPAWPLTDYRTFRSQPHGSISGPLRKRDTANSFTWASCHSWSSKAHTSTRVWQKIRSIWHFLAPPAIDKEPESNAKMYANQMAWRDGANLKAHIKSRAFPREIPVRGRSFECRFQPLSVGGFFSNQRESNCRCPKSSFPSKTQNRQIARTSRLTQLSG